MKKSTKVVYNHHINSNIAVTYIISNKKLTLVAALGVTIGIAIFIFMNSMAKGFDKSSAAAIFKTVPHIRIYKDAQISRNLLPENYHNTIPLIINPKIVAQSPNIINPKKIIETLQQQPDVTIVTSEVNTDIFINSGKTQIRGVAMGVDIKQADKMFNISSFVVDGQLNDLEKYPNGIFIGVGLADKMSLKKGDYIQVNSSKGISKSMKILGLFQTNNSNVDKKQTYIHINTARQLLAESNDYVSDIYVNINDYDHPETYAKRFGKLTGYVAEDWKTANATLMAASNMRRIIISFISLSILIVAGFGIYNILNMTIMQKINDIAILKAMGFKGKDVVRIFVQQALLIGILGIIIGLIAATLLISRLQHVYIGGDIGYFPVHYEPTMYIRGIIFGFIVTFLSGYIPAKKAANVDPVAILRK